MHWLFLPLWFSHTYRRQQARAGWVPIRRGRPRWWREYSAPRESRRPRGCGQTRAFWGTGKKVEHLFSVFRIHRIHMFLGLLDPDTLEVWIQIRILLSSSKNGKKNLEWLLLDKKSKRSHKWCECTFKKYQVQLRTWSPNKICRFNSIYNLWMKSGNTLCSGSLDTTK